MVMRKVLTGLLGASMLATPVVAHAAAADTARKGAAFEEGEKIAPAILIGALIAAAVVGIVVLDDDDDDAVSP
ncbi:hypothetical protein FHS61_000193 [Altererythrobacter atlanticus]|uniref:Uncharacterized protein n=1 Tax=Croceibacterium atlanticum TaxID=1267766 RepID=A0A0F7KPK7_9SPHN|nr:hypothetical protein [Croceibacterium atlanticum]AKH42423.1 hypothetical protein WYH_01382 [Croceibacterium atlanticum]MBB5731200.1 hypothetical protein [Croceibacterium atlanticum]